jgi:hypothetical protein
MLLEYLEYKQQQQLLVEVFLLLLIQMQQKNLMELLGQLVETWEPQDML